MSTYTDLHNRIKENLTILRKPGSKDDGMSPQKVILINPENQFYGTFNGKMNVMEGILSGLKIVNSELDNVKLDGATIDGVSLSELKDTIDVNTQDIEQLQKDAKHISASHDQLSTGLSSAIDGLSVKLNEKLDNTIEDVKKSISGAVGDVAILSDGFGELSSKVEALSSGTLNGVVYRGQLVLYHDIYTLPRQLFNDDPACCLLEGTQASLKNGWMWRIALDRQNISGDYVHVSDPNTGKELNLGEGDYIIIKNHLTSLYEVVPDNKMRLDDFDVINSQDEDDTKLAVLKQISAYLDNRIDESLVSAKAYTDEVSTSLSILFDRKLSSVSAYALDESIKYINNVSSELSNTVDARLVSLSNNLSSYSNKLCSDLSTQVDVEYVHRAGDAIAKLSVIGDLDVSGKTVVSNEFVVDDKFNANTGTYAKISDAGVVVKTHAGTLLKSDDQIEIKTNAPIVEEASYFKGKFTNGLEIASDAGLASLNVNGKTVQSTLDDLSNHLDEKKLDVELAKQLSSQLMISTDLPSNIAFDYLSADNILRLSIQGTSYDIDVTKFLDDKIVENVYTTTEDGKIWLHIVFKTSSSEDQKIIDICVNDLIHPYWAGHGISVDNNLCIHIANYFYDQVQNIQSYVDELSGPQGPEIGIIQTLSNEISSLRQDEKFEVQFKNLPVDARTLSERYDSIGAFLCAQLQPYDFTWVRNNTEYLVQFLSGDGGVPLSANIAITDSIGTLVGNGDIILIHAVDETSTGPSKVDFSEMVSYDRATKHGNTFIIKAGVSRYEFEAEATKRADDDNYISSWIKRNFANAGADNELSTTILNYDVSATKELSVASNAYVLNDLSVAGSLFVNGAQLGITVEPVDPEDPSGETEMVARTVADEVEFTTSSADNAPTISITRNAISFSSAPVYVSTSSFIISNDQTKVIDATSSQVEILSVLNVNSDQATITTLSSGILSVDQLIAREVEISENLSVENAFVKNKLKVDTEFDALSGAFWCTNANEDDEVYVNTNADYVFIGVANENARKKHPELFPLKSEIIVDPSFIQISSDTIYLSANNKIQTDFAKVKDFNSMSSIIDLCSALSISISSLSDFVISNDNNLSTAIDNKIFIDGISAESLCAIHISRQDYYDLVSSNSTSSNVLYVVSSDYINAYGEQLKNLAAPTELSDATTKEYVDGISSSLNSQIQQLSDDLSSEIGTLSTNLSTSISSLTSQMELALSALGQDPLSSLNRESKISTVIEAVLDIRDTLSVLRTILRI